MEADYVFGDDAPDNSVGLPREEVRVDGGGEVAHRLPVVAKHVKENHAARVLQRAYRKSPKIFKAALKTAWKKPIKP